MPYEEKGKESLQEVLKDLLSSNAPEPAPPLEDAPDPITREAEAPVGDRQPPAGAASSNGPGSGQTQPDYVVEIIPPPSDGPPLATESRRKWGRKRNEAPPSGEEEASEVELGGIVQVQVLPPTIHSRMARFEQALKGQEGVRWMGTLGKINLGTTIVVQLDTPTTPGRLFRGPAAVDKAELSRSGKEWHVKVWLPSTDSHASVVEAPLAGASPSSEAPAKPELAEEAPLDVYPESGGQSTPGQIDLQASPIASLDTLNRFEKLLTSLSPGCRIANVLSLDGVCTVLITLDGIDSETILRRLPQQINGVEIEVTPDRIMAKLPEKW
ncbi:MAG: hypothetical protein Q8R28_22475 [Dehalococcoidia bacterium]|nr:hypothetical protein [Dehalococcoidia bacterium]